MALSKRNSRKIVVDAEEYRWSPSQNSGYIVLVVQSAAGRGKKLEIIISDDKNVVIENGTYSIEVYSQNKLIVTPVLVERLIRDSIRLGWDSKSEGSPVELSLNEGVLEIRRGI